MKLILNLILYLSVLSCNGQSNNIDHKSEMQADKQTVLSNEARTVKENNKLATRILPPEGFERTKVENGSFAEYLRNLPLKRHGSPVLLYNGSEKSRQNVHFAVIDLPIGKKDLHQCADAIMRLKAEYHFKKKEYDRIHFNFTNGFKFEYSRWKNGERVKVRGNKTNWVKSGKPSTSYDSFWKYMEMTFSYAGTHSLSQELLSVPLKDVKIGDIFIQGGFPGHAVLVVDMVINKTTGEKLFLLAQSYMPAQETHVLINPNDAALSPWYSLNTKDEIITPEWGFQDTDLKRFANE